jgi:hypothetical protein
MWTITTYLNGKNYSYSENGIAIIFIFTSDHNDYCSRVYKKSTTQVSSSEYILLFGESLEEISFLSILKARIFGWDISFDEVISY